MRTLSLLVRNEALGRPSSSLRRRARRVSLAGASEYNPFARSTSLRGEMPHQRQSHHWYLNFRGCSGSLFGAWLGEPATINLVVLWCLRVKRCISAPREENHYCGGTHDGEDRRLDVEGSDLYSKLEHLPRTALLLPSRFHKRHA